MIMTRRHSVVFVVVLAVVTTLRAVQQAWLADDAFISFRYARHLVDGNGLVFNAGEYVEGYTNLLWTLAMALGMAFGLTPEVLANVLGIAAWLALAAVMLAWNRDRRGHGLPLAAGLTLLLPDWQLFSTGGLETSLFALLATAGICLVARPEPGRRQLFAAGVLLALATLTRPDGALYAALGVAAAWSARAHARAAVRAVDCAAVAAPLVAIGTALVVFKLSYYGELLPTAFYAKSASDPYYVQGLRYLALFYQRNWVLPLIAVLLIAAVLVNRRTERERALIIFTAAFVGFSVYVAHSGGDFMYARRALMAVPFLLLALEVLLERLPRRHAAALLLLAWFGACVPQAVFEQPRQRIHGIAYEHEFYPPMVLARRRAEGELAGALLGDSPLRAMFSGGMCMFAYYSALPYLAEMTGLTHYSLARQPLRERGAVGHEKQADRAWLADHDIEWVFLRDTPPLALSGGRDPKLVRIGSTLTAYVMVYRDVVMDRLRDRAEVDFVPIERVIAEAETAIARASRRDGQALLDELDRYYFRTAPAAGAARARLQAALAE